MGEQLIAIFPPYSPAISTRSATQPGCRKALPTETEMKSTEATRSIEAAGRAVEIPDPSDPTNHDASRVAVDVLDDCPSGPTDQRINA